MSSVRLGLEVLQTVRTAIDGSVPDFDGPIQADLIAGGRSNLTYRLSDAAGRHAILRRPPLGPLVATAHDMAREFKILSALMDTDVPTPPVRYLDEDLTTLGAPYYIMDFVEGHILSDIEAAHRFPLEAKDVAAQSLIDALVILHSTDIDDIGLGDLGHRADYIPRQLRRWQRQYEASRTVDLPVLGQVHDELAQRIPTQRHTGIVHGDYRLGNLILSPQGKIEAILDWELTALGDVVADLGWLLSSWIEPGEPIMSESMGASASPGFPSRREMADRYLAQVDVDPADLDFYVAFARWRSACIGVGVLARYEQGAMGEDGFDLDLQRQNLLNSADRAAAALAGEW